MIKAGQKVKINPFKDVTFRGCTELRSYIDGVVKFVHPTHQWFNVEYGDDNGSRLISFKFDDIGKAVKLVKD